MDTLAAARTATPVLKVHNGNYEEEVEPVDEGRSRRETFAIRSSEVDAEKRRTKNCDFVFLERNVKKNKLGRQQKVCDLRQGKLG